MPANPIVVMALDATQADRTSYLDSIDAATKSTDLYNVVTPEVTYVGYTIADYRYERRAARGVSLIMVELHLIEVRQVSAAYTQTSINNPQNPGATPQVNSGLVQPQTPSTSVLQSIAGSVPGLAQDATSAIQNAVQ